MQWRLRVGRWQRARVQARRCLVRLRNSLPKNCRNVEVPEPVAGTSCLLDTMRMMLTKFTLISPNSSKIRCHFFSVQHLESINVWWAVHVEDSSGNLDILLMIDCGIVLTGEPPSFSKAVLHFTVSVRSRLIIECSPTGHPPPAVKWTHYNGASINPLSEFQLENGSLHLLDLTSTRTEKYKCTANSSIGEEAVQVAVVTVAGKCKHTSSLNWASKSYARVASSSEITTICGELKAEFWLRRWDFIDIPMWGF